MQSLLSPHEYKLEGFNFCDDALTLNKRWMSEFCERVLLEKQLKGVIWSCNSRVDTVDSELLKKMARAGCRIIWYGMESGSQESLDKMKKGTTVQQALNVCQWTREARMGLRINLIIGFPWEDKPMIYETIRFAKSLKSMHHHKN